MHLNGSRDKRDLGNDEFESMEALDGIDDYIMIDPNARCKISRT